MILPDENEYILPVGELEIWWNVSIKTSTRIKHNKPDVVLWDTTEKTCTVLEFSCPCDTNITKKVQEKSDIYGPLIRNMQMMYPAYKFKFVPIIVGALGYVPTCLKQNISELGFSKKESKELVRKLQVLSLSGTVKICKTKLFYSQL